MHREEGAEGTTHFVFSWTVNGWVWENKMKQRIVIRTSTPGTKDLGAAPRFVLRKPILAEKCYT